MAAPKQSSRMPTRYGPTTGPALPQSAGPDDHQERPRVEAIEQLPLVPIEPPHHRPISKKASSPRPNHDSVGPVARRAAPSPF
jgi:hypothetical protein